MTGQEDIVQLRMVIGYLIGRIQIAGDKRSLPEILEEAERACAPKPTAAEGER